jgi:hypothetical protein
VKNYLLGGDDATFLTLANTIADVLKRSDKDSAASVRRDFHGGSHRRRICSRHR